MHTHRLSMSVPMMPLGVLVTAPMIEDVWNVYIVPTQADDAPPQSDVERVLMAILRSAYEAVLHQPDTIIQGDASVPPGDRSYRHRARPGTDLPATDDPGARGSLSVDVAEGR